MNRNHLRDLENETELDDEWGSNPSRASMERKGEE